ncbi:uncharacterized protein LOC131165937 [Malania oleifera]|uniref:uncharacterized protein LOC131165937 n=1 Tax=Malania oleifera TaxID=397392 RepID=UPI0025AEC16F|nr:uncharacterized protein LOC131165937 [Malania oleifera]
MKSRRHEEFMTQYSSGKLRNHRHDLGSDPYLISSYRSDSQDKRSLHSRRHSLSPPRVPEGSRRILDGDPRSSSVERRDYSWHMGRGRSDQVRSRSPTVGELRERPLIDEWVMHSSGNSPPLEFRRRYDLSEPMNLSADANASHAFDHSFPRNGKEKDFSGSRLSVPEQHQLWGQKSVTLEDGVVRGSVRLHPDFEPSSNYREISRDLLSSSGNLNIGRFRDENFVYREPVHLENSSVIESLKDGQEPRLYLAHPFAPASLAKDFRSTSQLKDVGSISSRIFQGELMGSYHEHLRLPPDEYPTGKLKEISGFNEHDQRSRLDSARHPDAGQSDQSSYSKLYSRFGGRECDDFGYPSNDSYQKLLPHVRVDCDHRDLVRSGMIDQFTQNTDEAEVSDRNLRLRKSSLFDHEETNTSQLDSRASYASRQGGEYLDFDGTNGKFGMKVSRDHDASHFGVMRDQEISHLRFEHDMGRDSGSGLLKGRLKGSPMSKYDAEMHNFSVRRRLCEEELDLCDSSDQVLKRKYNMDEEISRHNTRSIMSGKWKPPTEIRDFDDRGEEWVNEGGGGLFPSQRVGFHYKQHRKAEKTFDMSSHHRHSSPDDWLSYQDQLEHVILHENKHGNRYIKGHPRPGSGSWYNSYHLDRRSDPHRHHNIWKRSKDDRHLNVCEQDMEPTEEWETPAKSEPPEESEEFKQLAHKCFLKFSKKLNENPAVRRLYTGQRKAGSLFCIVCSRSLSKEFLDTQRLATHAFMSHKTGLRAQHLGLHKAICVLMGWNSVVESDTITWVPQRMSSAEALAQKEDLILWPPVIIVHDNSTMKNNSDEKVITIEALEAYLRRKGFIGGRIKVCLGNSANKSVLVVKFLGTFTGLQTAERLHNHFAEIKHGRADFENVSSRNGRSSKSRGAAALEGYSMEECVLYGYMGIAEDLDEVDSETRRRCLIKSKKEIQDIADAPVKPE